MKMRIDNVPTKMLRIILMNGLPMTKSMWQPFLEQCQSSFEILNWQVGTLTPREEAESLLHTLDCHLSWIRREPRSTSSTSLHHINPVLDSTLPDLIFIVHGSAWTVFWEIMMHFQIEYELSFYSGLIFIWDGTPILPPDWHWVKYVPDIIPRWLIEFYFWFRCDGNWLVARHFTADSCRYYYPATVMTGIDEHLRKIWAMNPCHAIEDIVEMWHVARCPIYLIAGEEQVGLAVKSRQMLRDLEMEPNDQKPQRFVIKTLSSQSPVGISIATSRPDVVLDVLYEVLAHKQPAKELIETGRFQTQHPFSS